VQPPVTENKPTEQPKNPPPLQKTPSTDHPSREKQNFNSFNTGQPAKSATQPSSTGAVPPRPPRTVASLVVTDRNRKLEETSYYFGNIDRKQAEEYLTNYGGTCFLIRDSSVKGAYAVSYLNKAKTFNHTLIFVVNGGFKLQDSNDVHPTAIELISKDPELSGFIPADKAKKGRPQVRIQIPDAKVVASIPSQSNISINELIKSMLSKANIQFKLDEFGLFSPDENLWLPGDKNFADMMGSTTPKGPLILQRKNDIHLRVKYNGKDYNLDVKKDTTVKSVIDSLKELAKINSTAVFSLQVQKSRDEDPIAMDEQKTVISYNLNLTDILELKEEKTVGEESDKKKKMIYIKVETSDVSSLFKISQDALVSEAFEMFLKKNPLPNPDSYGLCKIEGKKNKKKAENIIWLELNKTLSSCGIKNKDIISVRQKLRNRSMSRIDGIVKKQVTSSIV